MSYIARFLRQEVGGSGGEAPWLSRGVWGAARPPKGGSPSNGGEIGARDAPRLESGIPGGRLEREMRQDWSQEHWGGLEPKMKEIRT